MDQTAPPSLVIYLPDLAMGGVPLLYIRLIPHWTAAGFQVSLLLDRKTGPLLDRVPVGIPVIELGAKRQLTATPLLRRFLRAKRPDILLCAISQMNVTAVIARALAGTRTRLVVSQHNPLSVLAKRPGFAHRSLPLLHRFVIPGADAIVAVSKGVADDMTASGSIPRDRIEVIYNGVVDPDFIAGREAPPQAELATPGRRIVSVGRLAEQKDYATLLHAFAQLPDPDLQLLILGEGPLRAEYEALARELGVADRVRMPGNMPNPLPEIRTADLFVLSSRYEGFPLALIEALACGTPVVSTNCMFGPSEVLEDGRFGTLVPVGDPAALARGIADALACPADREMLRAQGETYSVQACAAEYAGLFDRLLARGTRSAGIAYPPAERQTA
jgi:glycosyltransferase involved in cell wall biosynthesis